MAIHALYAIDDSDSDADELCGVIVGGGSLGAGSGRDGEGFHAREARAEAGVAPGVSARSPGARVSAGESGGQGTRA